MLWFPCQYFVYTALRAQEPCVDKATPRQVQVYDINQVEVGGKKEKKKKDNLDVERCAIFRK